MIDFIYTLLFVSPTPEALGSWAWVAPAVAAAGGILGGMITNEEKKHAADKAYRRQLYMSNTAHQREVKDLEKAGLNPILSANAGASSGQTPVADVENVASSAISSAMEAKQLALAVEKQKEDIALIQSQRKNTDMDTKVKSKSVPEAELKNKAYEVLLKPLLDKLDNSGNTNVKQYLKDNYPKDPTERIRKKYEQQPLDLKGWQK